MKRTTLEIGRPRAVRRSVLRALLASTAILGGGAWALGCSLLHDLSTSQCAVDADCAAWPGLVCRESLCQEPDFECVTNSDCLESEEFFGRAAACIQNECQALTTPECPVVLPVIDDKYLETLQAENPLILGAFASTRVNNYGIQTQNYDLAVTEFTRAGVGRPLVVVVCNNVLDDRSELDRAMTHLADTLRVPGVIASLNSDDLQHAFTSKGEAANMFFVSPVDSESTLIRIQDRGLMWHMLPGGEAIAQSYPAVFARTLDYLDVTEPVRVAQVISTDERFLDDLARAVERAPGAGEEPGGISFNGMSVSENSNAGNYLAVNITSDPDANLTGQIQALLEFKPHVILASATAVFAEAIGPALEANWESAAPGQARPFYILSPYLFSTFADDFVASEATLRQRLIGLNAPAATTSAVYNTYVLNLRRQFGQEVRVDHENYYDAAYYMLYSAIAAGQVLNNGTDLVRGMSRLLSGTPFAVGADDLPDATAALALSTAGGIELTGTLGPPNFDVNGGRSAPGSVWCYDNLGLRQADVLTYNSEMQTMEGDFTCFDGF